MTNINQYFKRSRIYNLSEDEIVYKYIPIKYVKLILQNRTIQICKVSSWEDPYENFFYKQNYQLEDGTPVTAENLTGCIFGQSWTICPESDAMWRIYSPRKDAIRVKTTVGKLFDVFYLNDSCMATHSIGKVEYMDESEIEKWIGDEFKASDYTRSKIGKIATDSAYLKRSAFEHEHEVRLIINLESNDINTKQNYLVYNISPEDLFDEFCLDPRLTYSEASTIKNKLIALGIDGSKIKQSDLYRMTPQTIKI